MQIFDIMGPVMVGPSSSHTAGAVRIGRIGRHILAASPTRAEILLHGSFAATGAGHGTDRAIVAGLLDMEPDDPHIPRSLLAAKEQGLEITIGTTSLRGAHPNTALLRLQDGEGRRLELTAASLGGGRVQVTSIDGIRANFTADYPTLIIRHEDKPGAIAELTAVLYNLRLNIATMQVYRDNRGGLAAMIIESDEPIRPDVICQLEQISGFRRVVYLNINRAKGE